MKVLLLNGSPKQGNSYRALQEVAKTLQEEHIDTQIIGIDYEPQADCIGCGACQGCEPCAIGGASAAFDRLNKYFQIYNMPVVSSQYWNMVYGHVPGEAELDAEGLQTMRTLAHNMAWTLRSLQKEQRPTKEPKQQTNFIR